MDSSRQTFFSQEHAGTDRLPIPQLARPKTRQAETGLEQPENFRYLAQIAHDTLRHDSGRLLMLSGYSS